MFSSTKPFSAITVNIENFTSNDYDVDDIGGIPELVDVIKLQSTGPSEASRAIRKKLKYGNVHQQLRALTILDGLIQNAGERFQRDFVDEMLLERLRVCGTSEVSDPQVKDKCKELFRSWAAQYKNVQGLQQIVALHKQLPKRKQAITQERSKVIQETENPFDADEDKEDTQSAKPSSPPTAGPSHGRSSSSSVPSFFTSASSTAGSKKDKKEKKSGKKKSTPFSYEKEKGTMQTCIAQSQIASTNLMNALRSINREKERVSQNPTALKHFEECKVLRRKIYRYILYMTDMSDKTTAQGWVGPLLEANDKLVDALLTFENLDKSIDADSDSDDEIAAQAHLYKMSAGKGKENEHSPQLDLLQGLQITPAKAEKPPQQPARPVAPPVEEDDEVDEDENDPFGDSHAVETPSVEKGEPDWGTGMRRK